MPDACRLLIDGPAGGPWNMAVDETLLDWVASDGTGARNRAVLRLYQWSPATLSLGYFQPAADRAAHEPSRACPLVRRLSGGGAIVHDRELTYSLAVSAAHSWSRDTKRLYEAVHGTLVETFAAWGAAAEMLAAPRPLAPEPFLCFERRAFGDVVLGGKKIVGSAQRRRPGAVLQHGSILLARSPAAPELAGLSECLGQAILPERFQADWLPRLARQGGWRWEADSLTPAERDGAARREREKFATTTWNLRR